MSLVIGFVLSAFLLFSGAPLFVAFLAGALVLFVFYAHLPAMAAVQAGLGATYSYVLTAVPLFILVGNLMNETGIADAYFRVIRAWVGHLRAGLAIATVIFGVLFGTVCGGTMPAAIAVAVITATHLRQSGYSYEFIACLCASAGTLSIMIPPSLAMIILGDVTGVSVGKMFIGGILPGIMIAFFFCVTVWFTCRKDPAIKLAPRAGWDERGRSFVHAIPALCMPVLILGTIYGGIATPSESATIAAVAAIPIGLFYRKLTWKGTVNALKQTLTGTASIFWIIIGAIVIGRITAFINLPQTITQSVMVLGMNRISFLFLFLVLMFLFGMVFDAFILYYVVLPLLLPALGLFQIDLVPFCILFVSVIMIGQLTPPVCTGLFASLSVVPAESSKAYRAIWPFVIALSVSALVLALWPGLVSFLPNLMP